MVEVCGVLVLVLSVCGWVCVLGFELVLTLGVRLLLYYYIIYYTYYIILYYYIIYYTLLLLLLYYILLLYYTLLFFRSVLLLSSSSSPPILSSFIPFFPLIHSILVDTYISLTYILFFYSPSSFILYLSILIYTYLYSLLFF